MQMSSGPANEEVQRNFIKHKETYEKLKSDVMVKMQFLDENRVRKLAVLIFVTFIKTEPVLQIKVMHKQLLLFHNAIAAYFSGNATLLEATIKQFSVSTNYIQPIVSIPKNLSLKSCRLKVQIRLVHHSSSTNLYD